MSAWPVGSCPIARRGGGEDSTSHTQHAKRDTQHAQRYTLGLALEARYKLNANLAKTPPKLASSTLTWPKRHLSLYIGFANVQPVVPSTGTGSTGTGTRYYRYWYSVLQVVPVVPRLVSQRV